LGEVLAKAEKASVEGAAADEADAAADAAVDDAAWERS